MFDLSLTTRGPNILSIRQFINYFLFIYTYSFLHIFIFVTCKMYFPFVHVWMFLLNLALRIVHIFEALRNGRTKQNSNTFCSTKYRLQRRWGAFLSLPMSSLITKEKLKVTSKTITEILTNWMLLHWSVHSRERQHVSMHLTVNWVDKL